MASPKKKYKPRKPKKAVLDAPVAAYIVTITNGADSYVGTGDTIIAAFQNVPFQNTFFPLKGMVKVEHDGKVEQKFLFPRQMKLIMHNKIKRTMWAKMFSYSI